MGPFAGGLLAGLLFRLTHPGQCGDGSALFKTRRESVRAYVMEMVGTMLLVRARSKNSDSGVAHAPMAPSSLLDALKHPKVQPPPPSHTHRPHTPSALTPARLARAHVVM